MLWDEVVILILFSREETLLFTLHLQPTQTRRYAVALQA
jgi:hypothetical protein